MPRTAPSATADPQSSECGTYTTVKPRLGGRFTLKSVAMMAAWLGDGNAVDIEGSEGGADSASLAGSPPEGKVFSPGGGRRRSQEERNDDSDSEVCFSATAAGRRGNDPKCFEDWHLQAKARIWSLLSDVWHVCLAGGGDGRRSSGMTTRTARCVCLLYSQGDGLEMG